MDGIVKILRLLALYRGKADNTNPDTPVKTLRKKTNHHA